MRESIYALAFTVNLKNSVLEEHNVPEECRPSALQRIEVTVTGFLCAFCQLFVASLLLQEFVRDGIHERNSNFLAYIRGQTDSEPSEKTGESADDGDAAHLEQEAQYKGRGHLGHEPQLPQQGLPLQH